MIVDKSQLSSSFGPGFKLPRYGTIKLGGDQTDVTEASSHCTAAVSPGTPPYKNTTSYVSALFSRFLPHREN